ETLISIARKTKFDGGTYEEFEAAAWDDPDSAGHLHDQKDPDRALGRAWNRSRGPDSAGDAAEDAEQLEFTVMSTFAGRKPPERPWLIKKWIPWRQVTLLGGDGGTGKSLLALQLMM